MMTTRSVGFIGGGRVVSILLNGWRNSGSLPPRVELHDSDERVLGRLRDRFPGVGTGGLEAVAGQDVVFLALHPPAIRDAITSLKSNLRKDALLVSLAPKLSIAKLAEMLNGFDRIVRMIPNAPSIVGQGYNPIVFGPSLDAADRAAVEELVSSLGVSPQVPESQLEAYAVVVAMGPTYLWPQLYELKALAESWGLDSPESMAAIEALACGCVATMRRSGLTQDQVMDLIPAKPLAEDVDAMVDVFREKLEKLYGKLRA
jgi:pyrroline-5-carboxylate reductase